VLDFSGGKGRLLNLCPYCNKSFSSVENEKDFAAVVGINKKVVQ
jgi:hypothetical protein